MRVARARLGHRAGLAGGPRRPPRTRRCSSCWSPATPTATTPPARRSRRGRPSTAPAAATAARPPTTRRAAIRLRVPDEGETVVHDLIRGPVAFPNASYDDFVIARGDGSVLYNFAVAVDDAEMGITEVVRGDDHLSNTPKQLLVLEALGFEPPRYAHLPLLHGPDGKKLSKRHGAASVQELRDAGYLPAAVRNYLALLGWGTDDDTTLMSTEELVRRFRVDDVGKSAAIFDEKKLRWLNGRFMREMPLDEYTAAVARHLGREADEQLRAACAIAQEKAQTLEEVWPLIRFLFEPPVDDEKAWEKVMKEGTGEVLDGGRRGAWPASSPSSRSRSRRRWRRCSSASTSSRAGSTSRSGSRSPAPRSRPGIFESLAVLGRERSLERIRAAAGRLAAA